MATVTNVMLPDDGQHLRPEFKGGNHSQMFGKSDVVATLKACGRGLILTALLFWPVLVFAIDVFMRKSG